MNTPHLTIGAIVARKHELMGQASPQLVGELIDRLERVERDLLEVRSGGGAAKRETRSRLPDGVKTATDAATGRKVYQKSAAEVANADEFREWFRKNVPPGTVISNPDWWSAKILSRLKIEGGRSMSSGARRELVHNDMANSISDAVERGDIDLSDIDSIAAHVCQRLHPKELQPMDLEALEKFITREFRSRLDYHTAPEMARAIYACFGAPSFEPALWRVVTHEDHAKISEYYYWEWQAREHVNNKGGTLQTLAVIDSVTVHRPPDSNA